MCRFDSYPADSPGRDTAYPAIGSQPVAATWIVVSNRRGRQVASIHVRGN